jgi:predicted metal-dependent hydrolase
MSRHVPELPLPPYSYVPGGPFPHPLRDPAGHAFGATQEEVAAPNPDDWRACRPYLFGVDLFNHGYYWEAHEAWESLWHPAGRRGLLADFLKGLIKLAAAGVKVREGKRDGAVHHAWRAAELFAKVREEHPHFMGLDLTELIQRASAVAEQPPEHAGTRDAPVVIVFNFTLRLT